MAGPSIDRIVDGQAARRSARLKLFEPAELRHGTDAQRVHLLDLSVAGALLHAFRPPASGATVTLTCARFTRLGRVAWASERRMGVSFLRPLDQAELASSVGVATRDPAPTR